MRRNYRRTAAALGSSPPLLTRSLCDTLVFRSLESHVVCFSRCPCGVKYLKWYYCTFHATIARHRTQHFTAVHRPARTYFEVRKCGKNFVSFRFSGYDYFVCVNVPPTLPSFSVILTSKVSWRFHLTNSTVYFVCCYIAVRF